MRQRLVLATTVFFGLLATAGAPTASAAAPADAAPTKVCRDVRLVASIPAPPAGMTAQQSFTVDDQCVVRAGPVRVASSAPPAPRLADGERRLRLWSEMYDCCGILMNALYATHTWRGVDGQVVAVRTAVDSDWNREPWGGGWSRARSSDAGGCDGPCPRARLRQHAEFDYRGIFDLTGVWYYNTHDLGVELGGDGRATCELRVTARHWFVGWTWVRGCA